jgi:hypothetical protein
MKKPSRGWKSRKPDRGSCHKAPPGVVAFEATAPMSRHSPTGEDVAAWE